MQDLEKPISLLYRSSTTYLVVLQVWCNENSVRHPKISISCKPGNNKKEINIHRGLHPTTREPHTHPVTYLDSTPDYWRKIVQLFRRRISLFFLGKPSQFTSRMSGPSTCEKQNNPTRQRPTATNRRKANFHFKVQIKAGQNTCMQLTVSWKKNHHTRRPKKISIHCEWYIKC